MEWGEIAIMMDSQLCITRMVISIMETSTKGNRMVKEFITRIHNRSGIGISIHMARSLDRYFMEQI